MREFQGPGWRLVWSVVDGVEVTDFWLVDYGYSRWVHHLTYEVCLKRVKMEVRW